jgi:hypothetical protein
MCVSYKLVYIYDLTLKNQIMKSSLSIFLVLFFFVQMVQSQVIETSLEKPQQEMYDYHIQKHKKFKKTGFILLGAGGGAMLTGILIASASDSWNGVGSGALVFTAGLASTIASIPVFIIGNSDKRQANLILETGKIGFGGLPLQHSGYASAGLKISF